MSALSDDFDYTDKWLQSRANDPSLQVWSDADDEEIAKLAKVMLHFGQRSPLMATIVRETINTTDYITVAIVLGPRIQKTMQIVRATRGQGARFAAKRMRGVAS